MKKIIPHLWYNTEAKEAAALYTTLFPDSRIDHVTHITDTPSGDCDMVSFTLAGEKYMAISAGPIFTFTPAISLFTVFDSEAEIEKVWNTLIEGGKALMPYDSYPWAEKYGWLQDRYGLSWQLSFSKNHQMAQKITPAMMFVQQMAGKAQEAMELYTSVFPDSHIDMAVPYTKDDADTEGFLKHARFTLAEGHFIAMDSSGPHAFSFTEAFSLTVECDTQEEIDTYWNALSAVPESEQCGWLKDTYGVSWQIVPTALGKMMTEGSKEQTARVTQAFLKMKKFDIKKLEEAYSASE